MKNYSTLKAQLETLDQDLSFPEMASILNTPLQTPKEGDIPQVKDWPRFSEIINPAILDPADTKKLLIVEKFNTWFRDLIGTGEGFETYLKQITQISDEQQFIGFLTLHLGISAEGDIFDNLLLSIMKDLEEADPTLFESSLYVVVEQIVDQELKSLFSKLGFVLAFPAIAFLSFSSFGNIQQRLNQTMDDPDYEAFTEEPSWSSQFWMSDVTASECLTAKYYQG